MVLHGLALHLETSKALREGRFRYVLISFTILLMSTTTSFLNALQAFYVDLKSGAGGAEWAFTFGLDLVDDYTQWKISTATSILSAVIITIGDLLMVRTP